MRKITAASLCAVVACTLAVLMVSSSFGQGLISAQAAIDMIKDRMK